MKYKTMPLHPLAKAIAAITTLSVVSYSPLVTAQEAEEVDDIEVITIGTRSPGRTVTESPVPVDIFDSEAIQAQGSTDMNNILANLVPSFNVTQQPISDGSSFVRPVSLRGMAPDHSLILINGKRFHRAALVHLTPGSGAQGRGTQGTDVSNIPGIALKNIAVLRDGAAAQYGSDAIAGVVDFSLRDNSEGVELVAQYGSFYEGENEYKVSGNVGLPLGGDGFLNISGEFTSADELSRGNQHNAAIAILNADPSLQGVVNDPAQIWGRPENESYRTFWNAATSSGENEIYFFGNYAEVEATGSFFYRPVTGVAAGVGRNDVFGTDANGNCIQFCDVFPGGFAPRFSGKVTDFSQVVGYRGDYGELGFDISYSYGSNEIDYTIANTVNPALGDSGASTQTSFDPGAVEEQDESFNVDLTYPLTDEVFLAAGFEWRKDAFIITAGERASWDGDPAIAAQGFSVGSNGFGGLTPEQAGEFDRENIAIYFDAEWDASEDFLLTAALRYEDFTDFGSTANGKIAMRYNLSDTVVLRAAGSTGFKAPTVGQAVTSQVSTQFVDDGTGNLVQSQVATLPVEHPVSLIMGSIPLDAEESVNISAGATFSFDNLTLAVDYYSIDVDDRIGLTTQITPDATQRAAIDALGLTQNFSRVAYFTNAFDTETQGIDVVATYDFSDFTRLSLGYGWNDTKVKDADPRVVNRERQLELEEGLPGHKGNVTMTHSRQDWQVMARVNYFGEVLDASGNPSNDETASAEFTVDVEFTYNINETYTAAIGASNLFDEYPDETQLTTGPVTTGLPYFRQSPVGYNGGLMYVRLNAKF